MAVVGGMFGAVLVFARVGSLHGPTTRLFLATDQARGVIRGTEVWRSGVKIGAVSGIQFRSIAVDTSERVLVAFEVQTLYLPEIRRDTRAQIRTGSSAVGSPVVSLRGGTPSSPAVKDGDTLVAAPQRDVQGPAAQLSDAVGDVPVILSDVQSIEGQIFTHGGTIGALTTPAGARRIARLSDGLHGLTARVFTGDGTAGKFASDEARGQVLDRANHALAELDSAEQLAQSPTSSIGQFRADSTFALKLRDLDAALDSATRLLSSSGTIGRVRTDTTLQRRLAAGRIEVQRLMSDVERHPERYIAY
jgi:MlaD protein